MGLTSARGARVAAGRTVALLAVAAVTLAGCTFNGADDDGSPSASPSPSATASSPAATTTPTAEPGTVEAAVYFPVDTRAGFRLARETRSLDEADAGVSALETMIAGPEDPDYTTPWDPGTQVLSVEVSDDVVTVDLSEEARTANVGSELAALMVQQLVWTVTSALGTDLPVQLLIAGEPAGELWGTLVWDEPVARADAADTLVLVQIDSPTQGETVASPVTVSGQANAFEANVPWRVLDQDGEVVQEGFTMTSEGQTFAPFSFTVELEPGQYTVEVSEDDPSDGAAGEPMTDSRQFVVP